jgi:hypothetical protein
MYPDIVRLFHLTTVKGFVCFFHRTDDFLHADQSAYFLFLKKQRFHCLSCSYLLDISPLSLLVGMMAWRDRPGVQPTMT